MRTLNDEETPHINGGIDFSFFYGALAGAQRADYPTTAIISGLIGGAEAVFVSITTNYVSIGLVASVPISVVAGMMMGSIGYGIGRLFTAPPPQTVVGH